MNATIWIAIGALVLFGLADVVYKRAALSGVPAHQLLMVQTWIFLPIIFTYAFATGTVKIDVAALWGLAAGAFAYSGFYNFAASLKGGAISVNAPIFRLSFCVTAVLAITLLGEPVTAFKLAGLGLALLAVWLLLGGATGPARPSAASLTRVLLATAFLGLGNFLYKVGVGAGASPATLLVAQVLVVVPASTLVCASIDGAVRPLAATWRFAPWAALLLAGAFILLVEALVRGQASIVVPIAQMGFVITAAFGFLVLDERFTLRKGVGLVLAVAALASLAHG